MKMSKIGDMKHEMRMMKLMKEMPVNHGSFIMNAYCCQPLYYGGRLSCMI